MQKPKQVDIKETNIAGLGSKENRNLREKAAHLEAEWKGCGAAPGVEVWRIEKLGVKRWDSKLYGSFFQGDSYIVLNTYKKPPSEALCFNVHFWLGKDTSQDEMGVAAYKTVELDDLLKDVPVQYREVQGGESQAFLNCFGGTITVMQGGIESGFNHVKPEAYKARLLHVKGRWENTVSVTQVPLELKSLNDGDVFLLDSGLQVYQWNGKTAGVFEKRKGQEVIRQLNDQRNGRVKSTIIESGEDNADFWKLLGGKGPIPAAVADDQKKSSKPVFVKKCLRVSDASGAMTVSVVGEGALKKAMLKSDDVFLVDSGESVFMWVGKGANAAERKEAMRRAIDYLNQNKRPITTPIQRIIEGKENVLFNAQFSA